MGDDALPKKFCLILPERYDFLPASKKMKLDGACSFLNNNQVIIPKENEADLEEIPDQITKSLNIIPVEWIDEVISAALVEEPTPNSKKLKSRKTKNQSKNTNKQTH